MRAAADIRGHSVTAQGRRGQQGLERLSPVPLHLGDASGKRTDHPCKLARTLFAWNLPANPDHCRNALQCHRTHFHGHGVFRDRRARGGFFQGLTSTYQGR